MTATVERPEPVTNGKRGKLHTLVQRFRFKDASADAIAAVLMTKPLIGDGSVFGKRPGSEEQADGSTRVVRGFSPAPTFRFDINLSQVEPHIFVVRFRQPDRAVSYLSGDLVWWVVDEGDGAIFEEQVNTPRAMERAAAPLSGAGRSLRRWLFFRMGHEQVMDGAMKNIASLI